MKIRTLALILGLAISSLSAVAQTPDVTPPETAPPPGEPASPPDEPASSPAEPASSPAEVVSSPAEVEAMPSESTAASGAEEVPAMVSGDEIVPLIVIDEVPLTDAIRNLARQSGLNFQFDPRITTTPDGQPTNQPNVSIRFENVTAKEALEAVLDNYNLQLVREPNSRIARITVKDPAAPEPLVAKIIQLKYSDPTNMVTLLKPALSARSQVVADPRTSQLIVTTTEREMVAVIELIDALDSPAKQVLIEAHVYETTRAPNSIKGIDWSGTLEGQRFAFGNNLGDEFGVPANNDVLVGATPPGKLLADTARGFNPNTAFLDADGVSAVLSFLNKDSDSEVVATPRAVTLDNQLAILAVTRAFPIFNVTPGSANSPAGAQVTYTNLGTILKVTPRIAADNNISLHVVPEVSNIDSVDQQVLNGAQNTANIYAIRRIEAYVMIPSGNTLVMGGLISDSISKQYVKVPILGDLPGVGLLFRHEKKSRNKSNLLIFLTPTIVEEQDFHIASSGPEFLQTKIPARPDIEESAWESGKPHDWTKPVY